MLKKNLYPILEFDDDLTAKLNPAALPWRSREGIRYDLVMLCKKLVGII